MDIEKSKSVIQITISERVEDILNLLNHVLIGFTSLYMTWMAISKGFGDTPLHGWLCTLGYNLLMAEAIMCFYSSNNWSRFYSRQTRTTLHWVMQSVGSILAVAGVTVKFINKGFKIYSTHSILGIIATLMILFNVASGVGALYSQNLKRILTPIKIKALHNFLGLGCFVIGMMSLYYGFSTHFMQRNIAESFLTLLKVITVLVILLTGIGPIKSFARRIQTIVC